MEIVTNTGKTFFIENAVLMPYESGDEVVIKVILYDNVDEVFSVFRNPLATADLFVYDTTFGDQEPEKRFTGFTRVKDLRVKKDGGILIVLTKPEA